MLVASAAGFVWLELKHLSCSPGEFGDFLENLQKAFDVLTDGPFEGDVSDFFGVWVSLWYF